MFDEISYSYIKTILEKGSITEAANALFISQPSLSQFIKRTEKDLNCEIIIRESRPIKLTDAGQIYFESLAEIKRIMDKTREHIASVQELKAGKVTIGSLNYHSVHLLAHIIPAFRKIYPNIEINIMEGSIKELEIWASKGIVDLAITVLPLQLSNLKYTKLFDEKICIAVSPQNILAKEYDFACLKENKFPQIDLFKLINENFIVLTKEKRLRRSFEEASMIMGKTPHISMETNDITNALILASADMGITFCPNLMIHNLLQSYPLAVYYPKQKLADRNVIATYNSAYPLSKAASILLDMLMDYADFLKTTILNV